MLSYLQLPFFVLIRFSASEYACGDDGLCGDANCCIDLPGIGGGDTLVSSVSISHQPEAEGFSAAQKETGRESTAIYVCAWLCYNGPT